ncbi:50S ribosomal protein L10, partial [bacterium]|nr:50S ribosomal protein L10 [bacterium]
MNRVEKENVVSGLKDQFAGAEGVFLVQYGGLGVSALEKLRGKLRDGGASLRVAKARLMKRASDGIPGCEDMVDMFCGQVGLVFAGKDSSSTAKALVDFAGDNDALSMMGGV